MSPAEIALLAAVESHKTRLCTAIADESESRPPMPGETAVRYPREAIEQFVNGFFKMIEETLEHGTSESREFYMSTAMPAIRDSGVPVRLMVGGSARTMIQMAIALGGAVPAEHRDGAQRWLVDFFGDYLGEMAQTWMPPRA